MDEESRAMVDRISAELAELRAENRDLRRMFEASATDDRTIALKEAAAIIGRSDEFLRRKLIHGAKFGGKIEGRWVICAALLREWWAARKTGGQVGLPGSSAKTSLSSPGSHGRSGLGGAAGGAPATFR